MIKPTHWRPEALKADANAVSASKSYKGWSPVIEIAINIQINPLQQTVLIVEAGKFLGALIVSSPKVEMTSKPRYPKKRIKAPSRVPWKPLSGSVKGEKFAISNLVNPTTPMNKRVDILNIVNTWLKLSEPRDPYVIM